MTSAEVPSPEFRVPPLIRRHYRQIQFLIDLAVLGAAFFAAYLLRFDFALGDEQLGRALVQLPFVAFAQFFALVLAGAYRRVWRYTSLTDMPCLLRAAAYATTVILLVRLAPVALLDPLKVPLSIIIVDAVLGFGGIVAVRLARRTQHDLRRRREQAEFRGNDGDNKPVILVGAGKAGVMAVREIFGRGESDIEPIAFVDDDPLKQNTVIHGIKVVGTTEELPRLVEELDPDHVVMTIADASQADRRRIVDICEQIPIKVRTIPGYYEVLQGRVSISRIRDVEPDDLLGREPVRMDDAELREFLAGRRVLVTGAGGSIGSELARQIAAFGPQRLVLVERAEGALFEIDRTLSRAHPDLEIYPILADAGDGRRMKGLLERFRPQLVLHAAAHKHVPMMETSSCEALENNVLASWQLGHLAGEAGVEHFVLISTDKAVRPTSVMGASKRVAELVIQELDSRFPTRFSAVRFGNVLGSAGSVIPIFAEQIRAGGPVTVTHEDMRRYFMSISEAAQLVLRAGALAEGGEIMVLDMGEPVSIYEMAEKMIRLSGFEPHVDIPIKITGMRPGEKLFEELGSDEESLHPTRHPKIMVGKLAPFPSERLQTGLERIRELAEDGDPDTIRAFLDEFLPEAQLRGVQVAEPSEPTSSR